MITIIILQTELGGLRHTSDPSPGSRAAYALISSIDHSHLIRSCVSCQPELQSREGPIDLPRQRAHVHERPVVGSRHVTEDSIEKAIATVSS